MTYWTPCTISINKARTTILNLTKPLCDIAKFIADNVKACKAHKQKIFEWEGDIEELKKDLYIPTIDLKSTRLKKPMTVCGNPKCCENLNVNDVIKTQNNLIQPLLF